MSFVCVKCKKECNDSYALKRHMTQTKCADDNIKKIKCKYCIYQTTRKDNLKKHETICKEKLKDDQPDPWKEMEELKAVIREKNKEIVMLKKQIGPSSDIKGVLKNLPLGGEPLTLELFNKYIDSFTYDMFRKGMKGVIEFIEIVLQSSLNYVLRDSARLRYARLNKNNQWEFDEEGVFLGNLVLNSLLLIYRTYYNRIHDSITEIDQETASDVDDRTRPILFSILNDKSTKRQEVIRDIAKHLKKIVKKM